jgi:hypothetical protein
MITTADITNMRSTAESTMLDTCQIGTKSPGSGKSPNVGNWAWGADGALNGSVSCGVNLSKSREVNDGSAVTLTDGLIRIPDGTTDAFGNAVSGKHRIKVTHRFSTELDTDEIYAIVGEPSRGISATVCNVTRVVGETRK